MDTEIAVDEIAVGYDPSQPDPRVKRLSHSSRLTLHQCPRKFQLYKLRSEDNGEERELIHFAFGHAVGAGIQAVLNGATKEEAIWQAFLNWDADLLIEGKPGKNKSIFNAVYAVEKYVAVAHLTKVKDYELASFYDAEKDAWIPAVELSFRITFPNGYSYIGYVDAVLRHKVTGQLLVLELKTNGSRTVDEALYKNSGQALGYSIILDAITSAYKEHSLTDYHVLYLVYKTSERELEQFIFEKTYTQRALWIQELLFDIEILGMYEAAAIYPMHGQSCYDFQRNCEYFGVCTLPTERLVKPISQKELDGIEAERYTVDLTVDEVIEALLSANA